MKQKFLKIFLIIGIIFIITRIYQFIILNKLYTEINNFKEQENRYYSIIMKINEEITHNERIFVKSNIIKYVKQKENKNVYCEWKDFYTGKQYAINLLDCVYSVNNISIADKEFFNNMPHLIRKSLANGKIDIEQLIKIRYIIPISYNNAKCYRIVTENEIIIIDADTFLPIYSSLNTINSVTGDSKNIENVYEFKVGGVTEEDVKLPDLTGYIDISEN